MGALITDRKPSLSGRQIFLVGVVVAAALLLGHAFAIVAAPALHSKMLPWILGRGLGLAALVSLTGLVLLGIWLRHPWRSTVSFPRPSSAMRMHVALAAATISLTVAHLTALAMDHYAGVGWVGALVPGHAAYRPIAVSLGVIALWLMVIVGLSAGLAGRLIGRAWLPVHQASWVAFAAAWLHGITAGSDTVSLRLIYLACALSILALMVTRYLARISERRLAMTTEPR